MHSLIVVLALASMGAKGAPRVAPISLADLALYADAIVVGQVARVACVGKDGEIVQGSLDPGGAARCGDARTVAEVVVERVLRGDPATTRVWYFAQSTWTCDVTQAVPGERALFFLVQSAARVERKAQREAEMGLTGGQPVLRDAWSGRGRMPLTLADGQQRITAWDDVTPPPDLPVQPAQGIRHASIYWTARLEDVARWVETHVASTFLPLPAHPVSGLPACVAIVAPRERTVAAFWRDGTAVWSVDLLAGGPPYWQGMAPAGWVPAFGEDDVHDLAGSADRPTRAATRVVLRFPRAFHELSLGADHDQAHAVAQLRERILKCVPDDGSPLEQPLVLR